MNRTDGEVYFVNLLSLVVSAVTLGQVSDSAVQGGHEAVFQIEKKALLAYFIYFSFQLQKLRL